jgi:hypothetical protein
MKLRLLFALGLLCASPGALALDSVSVEAGRGDNETNLLRVGLQWQGHRKAFENSSWQIAHYIDLAFGGWNGEHGTVYDLGVTPVFRFQRAGGSPYAELAIGFHAISDLDFKEGVRTSTRFQFGDHIGVGVVRGRYDWSIRLQHLSNAGIRDPNPGINFLQLRLQYRYR